MRERAAGAGARALCRRRRRSVPACRFGALWVAGAQRGRDAARVRSRMQSYAVSGARLRSGRARPYLRVQGCDFEDLPGCVDLRAAAARDAGDPHVGDFIY
jgi:hypothetical protein